MKSAYFIFGQTLLLAFVVASCKKDNAVEPPVTPTRLTIFIEGSTNPFYI